MTAIDLTYSDTEAALRESVRSLLQAHCAPSRVAGIYDGDGDVAAGLWRTVSTALELPALAVAAALGGGGATPREVAVVAEELGRFVTPIPFLTSSVIATQVLASCAADDRVAALVDGSQVAVLAAAWTEMSLLRTELPQVSGTGLVTGTVRTVADAQLASVILVPANRDGILTLQVVDADAPEVTITPRSCLDMTRLVCDIDLVDTPSTELARDQVAAQAVRSGLLYGAAMLSSEQLGIADWCLESTVAYVKQRHQFGRPIGSFQAIKHRLARLWIAVNSARAAARNAAVHMGDESAVRLAQSFCSDVAVLAAEECVQLHGGIGMTWEHPAHLYLKRAKADQVALGSPAQHRAALARLQGY